MDILWILFAFACGFGVKQLGLPPLIGYLAAGFMLNFYGARMTPGLQEIADLGVTLMLFTIGLKLNIRDLIKLETWGGTFVNTSLWTLLFTGLAMFLGILSVPYFIELDWQSAALLAFALSFSSTVCVIKMLEESGEMTTRHGRFAVGILVMQDVIAVVFLVLAEGKVPAIWALLLPLLYFARPLFGKLLTLSGHGELLVLLGFMFALGAHELFYLVNIKGDLGALLFGVLLSQHQKANELSKSLLGFKDIFLVGFFLSIGLVALPDVSMMITALLLVPLLFFKLAMFYLTFARLRLRARTASLSSLLLTNYSEFGLIVMVVGVELGLIGKEWLVILALSISISFVITCVYYHSAHSIYARFKDSLHCFERDKPLAEDVFVQPTGAEILVIGTGRIGIGAYRALHREMGDRVWGMDADRDRIEQQREQGMHVFMGDGESADLWDMLDVSRIKLVLIAVPAAEDCRNITEQLQLVNYKGKIAAIARFEDDREVLLSYGIDTVFNFFVEAGIGFAEDSLRLIGHEKQAKN
ncbi:MAG: glutathione-regulated potassium-efflux system ancillary protein KefC [Gammaproteobacteria bacterium]|jgi:glutathione-regulated potassium-efflux system ancillary protein KefC